MKNKVILAAICWIASSQLLAQEDEQFINPLPARTAETDIEALRLMRNDKLDLVLPWCNAGQQRGYVDPCNTR